MVALTGNPDGTSEVDYTVNPATGFPFATGPRDFAGPLNSVLPAWDAVMGGLAATGLLAADRHRARTGEGDLITLALSDVAFAMVGHLGRVAEAELGGRDMRRDGNYLYGAFGHDFETADGRRVMVVALTPRQWKALLDATGLHEQMAKIAEATGSTWTPRRAASRRATSSRPSCVPGSASGAWPRSARASPAPRSPGVPIRPSRSWSKKIRGYDRQPDLGEDRAPRRGDLPDAGLAARLQQCRTRTGPPRSPPRRAHRSDPRELAGLSTLEIGRSMRESSAAR